VASRAVGLSQAAMDDAVSFAKIREAFGNTISNFQIVQSKITDMAVGIRTARLLVQDAAREMDEGGRARQSTSMAKMYASDVAQRTTTDSMQIHGAAGVSPEYRIGRLYRDAKVFQIVEGCSYGRGFSYDGASSLRQSVHGRMRSNAHSNVEFRFLR